MSGESKCFMTRERLRSNHQGIISKSNQIKSACGFYYLSVAMSSVSCFVIINNFTLLHAFIIFLCLRKY